MSGQSGSRKRLIQETRPELDASFFSSTPYETTIVPGIISSSLEAPETSDYPTDAEIELALNDIWPDQSTMFSEIGASKAATDFAHMLNGNFYEDLFHVDYTKRNEPGIISSSLEEPETSGYPTDAEIELALNDIWPDQSIMFSEIGASKVATDFAHMLNGNVYEDLFPVDYTKRNERLKKWHAHFIDRICQRFANRLIGKVYLISKFQRWTMQ